METLRISELAERAHVPVSTLRYYERIGLLGPPPRLENGYRVYDDSVAEQLSFIARAKRMGMPLSDVAELLELWSAGGCRPLQERIRLFLAERIAEVGTQRRDLTSFEGQLRALFVRLEGDDPGGANGRCELDCECVRLEPGPDRSTSLDDVAVCSLSDGAKSERKARWAELLQEGGAVERTERGRRVAFAVSPEIVGRLGALCGAEVGCCSFLSFAIRVDAHSVVLEIDAPNTPDAARLMESVFAG